uniref:Ig-like domain-containing protein n=1 Tax=Labrus bergylta TaxID=56723 RepID=A0A3Q3GHH5_9LABR
FTPSPLCDRTFTRIYPEEILTPCFSLTDKIMPPSFSRKLKDCNTVVGNVGEMECKVSGSPPFTVSWYHDGAEIQTGPNYDISFSDNNCTLKVPTLKLLDSGVYKCKAVNKAGSSETSASLVVKEAKTPPSFPKKITSLQQTEGLPVRFECRIAGSSPIEVSWLRDGEPVREGDEFSMTYDDNTAVLQIGSGEMRHSGEYTCVATNSVGSASCRAKLTLQGFVVVDRNLNVVTESPMRTWPDWWPTCRRGWSAQRSGWVHCLWGTLASPQHYLSK